MDGIDKLAIDNREFARLAGISVSRFFQLRQAGVIPEDELRAPIPGRWNRERVVRWLVEGPPAITARRGRGRKAA